MVLSGVGDALGYNNGEWEFCPSGSVIQNSLAQLGGLTKLKPTNRHMRVSDDTVMHIATAEALLASSQGEHEQYCELATQYRKCMNDMQGRAPGLTCMASTKMLYGESGKYVIPFNPRGGGCGAAMRAVPIGLLYHRPEDLYDLVRVGVESGRMTHNHPTGFLGSVAVALFVSYAVQGKDVREWGEGLLHTLHTAKEYCKQQQRDWREIEESWDYFEDSWTKYLDGIKSADFSDIQCGEYDNFVKSVSYSGTGGASGHDAPLIAYEAILRCCHGPEISRWERLCRYGMFHGGDSDSTGIIAGACYGAMFGLEGVPLNNYIQLEYRDRLAKLGSDLYDRSELIKKATPSVSADQLIGVSGELLPPESGTTPSGTEIGAVTTEDTSEIVSKTGSDMDTTGNATSEPVVDSTDQNTVNTDLLVNLHDDLKVSETSSNTEDVIDGSENMTCL